MGCDWYTFTSVSVCGIIFISKTLPKNIVEKYNLIKIDIPINPDLNFTKAELDEKNSALNLSQNSNGGVSLFSKRYKEIPILRELIEESYYNNDREFVMDLDIEDDKYIENNVEYLYIYPCGPKQVSSVYVSGPYEIIDNKIQIGFINPKDLNDNHTQILQELNARYSFGNESLFNYEKMFGNENYNDYKKELSIIQNIPIIKTQPSFEIPPKIYNILISSSSEHLLI